MFRVRDRFRLLARVLGASLALQSVFVGVAWHRMRSATRSVCEECAGLAAEMRAALAAVQTAGQAVDDALAARPAPGAASPDVPGSPDTPETRCIGVGRNGRFVYADLSTDYHDGEPPTVRRVYRRIPDALRDPRFRSMQEGSPVNDGLPSTWERSDPPEGVSENALAKGPFARNENGP